jgi:hypothetical protein
MDLSNFAYPGINLEKMEQLVVGLRTRLDILKKLKAVSDEAKSAGVPLYIPSKEMAEALGITEKDLSNIRNSESGLKYSKPGSKNIYYEWDDVLPWLPTRKFSSTKAEKASLAKKQIDSAIQHSISQ